MTGRRPVLAGATVAEVASWRWVVDPGSPFVGPPFPQPGGRPTPPSCRRTPTPGRAMAPLGALAAGAARVDLRRRAELAGRRTVTRNALRPHVVDLGTGTARPLPAGVREDPALPAVRAAVAIVAGVPPERGRCGRGACRRVLLEPEPAVAPRARRARPSRTRAWCPTRTAAGGSTTRPGSASLPDCGFNEPRVDRRGRRPDAGGAVHARRDPLLAPTRRIRGRTSAPAR